MMPDLSVDVLSSAVLAASASMLLSTVKLFADSRRSTKRLQLRYEVSSTVRAASAEESAIAEIAQAQRLANQSIQHLIEANSTEAATDRAELDSAIDELKRSESALQSATNTLEKLRATD